MAEKRTLRVGTRSSQLARVQTDIVVDALKARNPDLNVDIVAMKTTGDRVLSMPLSSIGSTSLFTKELEIALLESRVDLVVHSLKDVPTLEPDGLVLAAVLQREDARDALVTRRGDVRTFLTDMSVGSVIGTSSRRRMAQLRRLHPHLVIHDIRGNLNTRLAKLDADDSPYAALVLAAAGLHRLGWHDRIAEYLDIPYAVGQGALVIQCRAADEQTLACVKQLECSSTRLSVTAERSIMRVLEGGCSVPLGVTTEWLGEPEATTSAGKPSRMLRLTAMVTSINGREAVHCQHVCQVEHPSEAESAGTVLAARMMDEGADRILKELKKLPLADYNV